MNIALEQLPYAARRQPVFATQGMVATSQPLAAQAGLAVLRRGGNAVDAALATAITLTVVEPASCGMGGDAFAIVWDGQRLHGLNGSGRAPARISLAAARANGRTHMPESGWMPTTVPGAPVFVGKADRYRAKKQSLGIDVDLAGHNALQSTFVFDA